MEGHEIRTVDHSGFKVGPFRIFSVAAASQQLEGRRVRPWHCLPGEIHVSFIAGIVFAVEVIATRIAEQFERIPTPAGYKGDEVKQYRGLIQQQADGLKAEAKNSYKAAVDRSQELEAYTEWTDIARAGLQKLDPQSKSAMSDEIVTDAKATDWMGL